MWLPLIYLRASFFIGELELRNLPWLRMCLFCFTKPFLMLFSEKVSGIFSSCRCIKPQLKSLALGFHALATRTLGKSTAKNISSIERVGVSAIGCKSQNFSEWMTEWFKCLFRLLWTVWAGLVVLLFWGWLVVTIIFGVCVYGHSRDTSTHLLWSNHWHHMSKMGSEEVWRHWRLQNIQHHRIQVVITFRPSICKIQLTPAEWSTNGVQDFIKHEIWERIVQKQPLSPQKLLYFGCLCEDSFSESDHNMREE